MWIEKENHLWACFQFKNFIEAMTFMLEVAFICEKLDHHPDWTNVWNKVEIKLSTHSAGHRVTERDRDLAREIDKIYEKRIS